MSDIQKVSSRLSRRDEKVSRLGSASRLESMMDFRVMIERSLPKLDAIPVGGMAVQRLLRAVSLILDSRSIDEFAQRANIAARSVLFNDHRLVVVATRCQHDLLIPEVMDFCIEARVNGLIVRVPDDLKGGPTTFDLKIVGHEAIFRRYALWTRSICGFVYFVPTVCEGPVVRVTDHSIAIASIVPFASRYERHQGLRAGEMLLAAAIAGWF